MKMLATFAVAIAAEMASCPPPAPAPDVTSPDAGPGVDAEALDVYGKACANLAAVGCPEGRAPNCAEVLRHSNETHLIDFRVSCIAHASSPAGVRACGPGVKCPGS